jgi:hypothetical protein
LAAISVAAIAVTMTACGCTGSSASGGLNVDIVEAGSGEVVSRVEKELCEVNAERAVVVRIAPSRAVNNRTLGALIRNGGRSHPGCWRWWRRHQPWQRDRRHAGDLYDARLGALALFG